MKPFTAVLVGLRHNLNFNYLLAPACLKSYAESRPELSGRARVETLQRAVHEDPRALADEILSLRPGLAGFSCYLWNIDRVLEICRLLRALAPGVKIALGGPEAAPQAERLLREGLADFVCLGEGEAAFAGLLARLADGDSGRGAPGFAWAAAGVPVEGPVMPPVDLAAIPSPLLSGLLPLAPGFNFILETSRGCPFKCAFCDWQNGRPVRNYPVERAVREVSFLAARVPRFLLTFSDADIFLDLPRAKSLLRGLRPLVRGRNCLVTFLTYLPRLDGEALALLDLPQFQLGAGVQSLNPGALDAVRRPGAAPELEAAERRLRALAPRCRLALDLIYGLPGDDLAGFRASLDWALARHPDVLSLQPALALPGADLGRRPGHYGLEVEPGAPHRVLGTPSFPPSDLRAAAWLSYRVLALNEDPLFRWTAARLASTVPGGTLAAWERLAARAEAEAPEAGLAALCGCTDVYSGDCDMVGVGWRRRLGLGAALKLWAALERAALEELPPADRAAFRRAFRRRRLKLFAVRALSGPALEPLIRRLDRLLPGAAGRLWQRLKLAFRAALGPAGGEGAA